MAEALHHGVGKRKTSVARICMRPGAGNITINKKPMAEYLVRESDRMLVRQPLEITETLDKYDIQINVRGGGLSGQAGAIRHGITRTLMDINPDFRLPLKQNDLLTRDSRMKERKKYGQPGARKRFQYSKR
jgi:small subunit ribosomal protein S9